VREGISIPDTELYRTIKIILKNLSMGWMTGVLSPAKANVLHFAPISSLLTTVYLGLFVAR
jgi:hypothetical protein